MTKDELLDQIKGTESKYHNTLKFFNAIERVIWTLNGKAFERVEPYGYDKDNCYFAKFYMYNKSYNVTLEYDIDK